MLRGFSAFDVFLEQHPEFRERVTFIAQLMPSRTDVPEYAEYLERIEAVVAVVNHRHGSPDWMPIQLKLRDDLEEAVAAYKHYDVLMVNAMFDGMNLVAKEGPMVNERAGVSILSENTGAHEELGEYALSVNPFDIQELADSIHAALTMPRDERERRHEGLEVDRHRARPGRLDRRAARRHPAQERDAPADDLRVLPGIGLPIVADGPVGDAVAIVGRRRLRPLRHASAPDHLRPHAAALDEPEDEARAKILADVESAITAAGGTVERNQNWGTRPMTYQIRHQAEAEYHLLQFAGPPSLLESLVAQPADRRRGAALPDHQGPPGHASAAG